MHPREQAVFYRPSPPYGSLPTGSQSWHLGTPGLAQAPHPLNPCPVLPLPQSLPHRPGHRRWVLAGAGLCSPWAQATAAAAPATDWSTTALLQALALTALTVAFVSLRQRARRRAEDDRLSRAMLDHSPQLIGLLTAEGQVLRLNQAATAWLGPAAQTASSLPLWAHAAWAGQAAALRRAVEQAAAGLGSRLEVRLVAPDGQSRHAELSLRPVRKTQHSRVEHLLLEARDVTVRKQAEDKLMLAAAVFEQAREGIMVTDAHGSIVSVNQAFTAITGFDADEVQGQSPTMLTAALDDPHVLRRIRRSLIRDGHWQGELRSVRRNGSAYTAWVSVTRRLDADGHTSHLIGILNDITEAKQAEAQLLKQAHYDSLTDLPNRHLLNDRLQRAIQAAARDGSSLALLFMDLNQLRDINDNFSHRTGDAVLLEMAQRLRNGLRETDTVARLGGDEFAVLLPGAHADGAVQVATKLLEQVAQPCMVLEHELSLTMSVGIAVYPADGETPELLSRSADTAMYRAKQEGRSNYRFFAAGMQQRSVRHLQLDTALRRAVERNELRLHYQPQLAVATGEVVGLEALVRWHHPELGMISPGEFIPLAEASGQILVIGEWVMKTAARQMRQWMDQGLPPTVVAVNLSAIQFRDPTLPERVQAILTESGLPPDCLELELTESVATGNPSAAIAMMDRLHALGVRLSIDDFGTGYSSLNYLKRFRIHTLKIDQSFVRDIGSDADDRAIVQAIVQMAHALQLTTIAEGVETQEQALFLGLHGCDMVQGYRYCRPVPPEQAFEWVQARRLAPTPEPMPLAPVGP